MKMLAYVSHCTIPLHEREQALRQLRTTSQKRNAELEISGVLFLRGSTFLQTIEGPPKAVEAVFQSISADKRHKSICLLLHETIIQRRFPGWAMKCFHEPTYELDYLESLNDLNRDFCDDELFSVRNVLSYFSDLVETSEQKRLEPSSLSPTQRVSDPT